MTTTFLIVATLLFSLMAVASIKVPADKGAVIQMAVHIPMATFGWLTIIFGTGWIA